MEPVLEKTKINVSLIKGENQQPSSNLSLEIVGDESDS